MLSSPLTYHILAICCECNLVITIGDSIAFDPLMTVLSSLTLYRLHLHFLPKIHLQPLIKVIFKGRPCASLFFPSNEIESAFGRAVCGVVLAGSCDLHIGYVSVLHPQRVGTSCVETKYSLTSISIP